MQESGKKKGGYTSFIFMWRKKARQSTEIRCETDGEIGIVGLVRKWTVDMEPRKRDETISILLTKMQSGIFLQKKKRGMYTS